MDEQNELYQVLEQQNQALETLQADKDQLQQQLQIQSEEISSLKAELVTAYKQIQSLSSSDLQLKEAQQLKASASADLENSKQLLQEQKSLQQINEQKEKELQSSRQQLEAQKKELADRESSLQKTIEDAKAEAQKDAAASLADDWQKLEDAKNEIEKEQEEERQRIGDLREAAERELESAQKAKADAAEKAAKETKSTYKLAIYAMILFCIVLGLVEVYKHKYIFGVYADCYTTLSSYIGFWATSAVAAIAATIFFVAYFVPIKDSDGLYFGLSIRLIVLVTLFASSTNDYKEIAAVIIYLSSIVIGFIRRKSA